MNKYIGFFNRNETVIEADTLLEAKNKAIDHFKPTKSKRHMVHVHLAEKDGEPVVHVADF